MQNTAKKRGGHVRLGIASLLVVAAIVAALVFSRFGGFGTGPSADATEFAKYAQTVSEIDVPEKTRVVALGEATHGNREFQELKLDVFKVMVEKYGVRAFALEADCGGCETANRYVHGGEGTAAEAAEALVFTIYRTAQIAELLSWMRDYNETAAPGQDLRFYGFDMQSYEHSLAHLLEEAQGLGIDVSKHRDLESEDGRLALYGEVRKELEALDGSADASFALHLVDVLEQNNDLGKLADSPEGAGVRDRYMAQNVLWNLRQEEQRGNGRIFISAHNGHVEQSGSYGPDAKVMGSILADELGDAYYAIGTDFFEAEVNLPDGNGRMTHAFFSHDPLAKAAATNGFEVCWLDFARVPADSPLRACIDGPVMMGSVGETFSPLMYVLPQTYRVKREPASPYDSMIFVAHAHPTEIVSTSRADEER